MKEIEKEGVKGSESQKQKVEWCMDDTLFISAIVLAGFATILFFILPM